MVELPDGSKILRIYSAVLTEYRRVTDGPTDIFRQQSPRYAYASRGKNRTLLLRVGNGGLVIRRRRLNTQHNLSQLRRSRLLLNTIHSSTNLYL